ncbi:MAG: extracellular solute-binding protein [Clostridium sp.]|nr:extracellular solute-binding protein [Acetatifactor muris]MCM1527947.1 extracellular solute-binding protein [Bacteroides sp.]MCM1564141.1 extracellular solute-binding protein [Clostridium sp.]
MRHIFKSADSMGKSLKNLNVIPFLFLLPALLLFSSACKNPQHDRGSGGDSKDNSEGNFSEEYVLLETILPEYDGENLFRSVQITGNKIYCGSYSYEEVAEKTEETSMKSSGESPEVSGGRSFETIRSFSMRGELLSEVSLPLGDSRDSVRWHVDDAGNIRIAAQENTEDAKTASPLRLYEFDAAGTLLLEQEFDRLREYPAPNDRAGAIAADGEGRICVLLYDTLLLFDESGNFRSSVRMEETFSGNNTTLVTAPDGTVCALCQTDLNSGILARVNFDSKTLSSLYTGLPPVSGGLLTFCGEGKLLLSTEEGPCLYNADTKEQTLLFSWLDKDLVSSSVRGLAMSEDGTLFAAINERAGTDGTGGTSSLLLKFGADPEEAAADGSAAESASSVPFVQSSQDERTIITLAAIQLTFWEKDAIVEFNRSNELYRIETVEYLPNGWNGSEELKDAQSKLEMEMALDSKGYDIISLSYLNMENLAAKGIFEDLYPFLDREGGFEREDFFESILNAYTVEDRLICIPDEFTVQVLLGKTADLGDRHGWTLRELLDYNSAHPETLHLFTSSSRGLAAQALLYHGNDGFIGMESGEVWFDRAACEDVLKLLKSHNDASHDSPTADRLQRGEVLLTTIHLYAFDGLQLDRARFGEPVTWIGWPDAEGNAQVLYEGQTQYAISSRSDCKEGAWAWLEYYLGHEQRFTFPSRISEFEKMAERALKDQYKLDADGNIRLDENGDPELKTIHTYNEGSDSGLWSYTSEPITEADVAQIRQIVETGGKAWHNTTDEVIYQAVMEEGAAYFTGQKPVDAVVDVLENRLKLYLEEQ